MEKCWRLFCERAKALACLLAFLPLAASAQPGGTTTNGTSSAFDPVTGAQIVIPGFLFEPEVPLASLKTAPIWNELERLLDNPYQVALCSALSTTRATALVRNTPGTTLIVSGTNSSPIVPVYPAYCSNFPVDPATGNVRGRPEFGVALPPLMVHPLNY